MLKKNNTIRQLLPLVFLLLVIHQYPTITNGYDDIEPSSTTCTQCTANGNSWQDNTCTDPNCPIQDIGCCQTTECCVTDGCRAPNENYWISADLDPVSCTSCCEPLVDDGEKCLLRQYNPDLDGDETYNAQRIMDVSCPTNVEDCPPCAICTKHDEEELLIKLKSSSGYDTCSKTICDDEKNINYVMNPCDSDPEGCGCWCQNVTRGLGECPHLEDAFWDIATSSSSSFDVMVAADSGTCTACVSGGYSWQVGGCEEEYCPIQDVGCCTSVECCDDDSSGGCRLCDLKNVIWLGLMLGILW